jgi:membrane-associated protease RseP (regulator of RpoE activity)
MKGYESFKSEIAAGGAVHPATEHVPPGRAAIGIAVIIGLLVWLLTVNLWMFVFVIGILVSVFLHELGHFVTARRTGMKATQFYMGFGPRLWSFDRRGVEYGLRAFPLGAFVRIIGMNNLDEVEPEDEPMAYRSKSYPRRLLVISAGSIMHMIIAIVLLVGVYATAGKLQESGTVTITGVAASSPAEVAGLAAGDVVVSVDGVVMTSRSEFIGAIQAKSPADRIDLVVVRNGSELTLEAGLGANPNPGFEGVAYLGVGSESLDRIAEPLPAAIVGASQDLVSGAWQSVRGVFIVLNPVNLWQHLSGATDDLETRPTTLVGATQISGAVGERDGLAGVLTVLASVNVFVGILNMAPLLPLDGGHAAIATYERIRSRKGRPYHADISKMVPVATVVVVLLGMLLLTGLYLDITEPLG